MHRLGVLTLLMLSSTPVAADPSDETLIRLLQERQWFKVDPAGPPGSRVDAPRGGDGPTLPNRGTAGPAPIIEPGPSAGLPPSLSWRPSQPSFGLPRLDPDTTARPTAPLAPGPLPGWARLPDKTESAAIAVGSYQAFKLSRLESVGALNAELIAKGVERSLAEKSAPYLYRLLTVRGVGAATLGVAVTAGGIFVYDWFVGDDDKKHEKK